MSFVAIELLAIGGFTFLGMMCLFIGIIYRVMK